MDAALPPDVDLPTVLASGAVRAAYQPIVDLATGEVVAFEALARGPEGTDLARPDQLFAAAESLDLVAELDWECRAAAVRGALAAGLGPEVALFVNVEPRALGASVPDHLRALLDEAAARLQVLVEITERALLDDPAALLARVRQIRELGWGIALDDVGAEPASLAVMPLLRPDVIKLDMALIRERTTAETATVMNAVLAQAEETGATVLAEGIEDLTHLRRAISLGAVVGQGWKFGRPGPLPAAVPTPASETAELLRRRQRIGRELSDTPYELLVRRRGEGRVVSRRMLLEMSNHLERKAADLSDAPVVLSTFQRDARFTPATAGRYAGLATRAAFVGAVAADFAAEPAPGVRGMAVGADHPLVDEWIVCVVSSHFAAALVAHEVEVDTCVDCPDDEGHHFAYHLVYEREVVLDVARRLFLEVTTRAA